MYIETHMLHTTVLDPMNKLQAATIMTTCHARGIHAFRSRNNGKQGVWIASHGEHKARYVADQTDALALLIGELGFDAGVIDAFEKLGNETP